MLRLSGATGPNRPHIRLDVYIAERCPKGALHPGSRGAPSHGLLPSGPQSCPDMPQRAGGFFHLHLVSDATGETLITVARAAAAQYATVAPIEHIYPLVRNEKQLERVISEIEAAPGVVLYTLLDRPLADRLETKCQEFGVPYLSILGPVLTLFQSFLGAEST